MISVHKKLRFKLSTTITGLFLSHDIKTPIKTDRQTMGYLCLHWQSEFQVAVFVLETNLLVAALVPFSEN